MKRLLAPLAIAALLIAGCGAPSDQVAATSATPTPTPTVAPTATPQEYASVIAEHEAGWREYEENIVDCALASVVGEGVLDEIKAMTCRTTSSTVTMTANKAIKDFRALDTPPSGMAELVVRTLIALEALGATGADKACSVDRESQACDDAATLTNGAIRPVVSVLDAWKPYTG